MKSDPLFEPSRRTESLRRLASRALIATTPRGSGREAAVYELTALGASFAGGPLAHLAEWVAENQGALSATS